MQIQSGNEINPFDWVSFQEMNEERFGGRLTVVPFDNVSVMVTTPPDMSDRDLSDAVYLVDNPILH
jgi:hypothetical protein